MMDHSVVVGFRRIMDRAGWLALALLGAMVFMPFLTSDPLAYSIGTQILIGASGALGVYVMLRMELLNFAIPGFMAVGGYAAAISASHGVTDIFALAAISFMLPGLLSIPVGAIVLRLKGVYFVLITYIFTEIVQLVLIETPSVTGGTDGLIGFPVLQAFGVQLTAYSSTFYVSLTLAALAFLVAIVTTRIFRQQFSSIAQNDVLAESFGLTLWRYKTIGFFVSSGVAGLAGFSLVNMLLIAHPLSFTATSAVNYIAYAFIGGTGYLLGPLLGSALLVSVTNALSFSGEYSEGFFGIVIMIAVLVARGGLAGALANLWGKLGPRRFRQDYPRPASKVSVKGAQ